MRNWDNLVMFVVELKTFPRPLDTPQLIKVYLLQKFIILCARGSFFQTFYFHFLVVSLFSTTILKDIISVVFISSQRVESMGK